MPKTFLLALAVLLTLSTASLAHTYDLLIKGGTVYDPAFVGVRDVGIKNGIVVAVETDIDPELAAEVYDATGKTVAPGLVNLHLHCLSSAWPTSIHPGVNCDQIAAARGYTTIVSAGDAGWPNASAFRTAAAGHATRTYAFLNIAWRGMSGGAGEYVGSPVLAPTAVCPSGAITRADIEVCETAGVLAANWQFYVGIKVRLTDALVGSSGLQILQMAIDAATKAELYSGHRFKIMVHVGALASTSTIDAVIGLLRSGDILTHTYSEWLNASGVPTGIAQNSSCANHQGPAAVAKGVVIDLGASSGPTHGASNAFGPLSYVMCGKIGITADSLSSDEYSSTTSSIYSMTDMASILIGLNNGNNISPTPPLAFQGPIQTPLTLLDLIYKMTRGPALVLGDRAPPLLGTLHVGAPGDVAILNVQAGAFTYALAPWGSVTTPTKITVEKTVKGGALM